MIDAERELAKAIQTFWVTRGEQQGQGADQNVPYAGSRSAVVGGQHANGFIEMIAAIVRDAGVPDIDVRYRERNAAVIPGYYRPSKNWDLVAVRGGDLIAVVEVKSQVGSFGNNFNNRVEEAVGNATDLWAAYSKGLFGTSQKPWLGYLFMLQAHADSMRATRRISLRPFNIDNDFQERSYAKRYELACQRLMRERLYDSVCFVMSDEESGREGQFTQPNLELGILPFARSLYAHAAAYANVK